MKLTFVDGKIIRFSDNARVSYSKAENTVYVNDLGKEYKYNSKTVKDVSLE